MSERGRAVAALVLAAATFATGCGYRAQYAAPPVEERLAVVLSRVHVTPTSAADAVALGVRDVLAEHGALASGTGYPRVEVEVLRLDEESEGIAAEAGRPLARALRVAIVARASVRARAGGETTRDTGDLRATSTVAATTTPAAGGARLEEGARDAGRAVGRKLGARLLGHPTVSE